MTSGDFDGDGTIDEASSWPWFSPTSHAIGTEMCISRWKRNRPIPGTASCRPIAVSRC